MDEHPSTGRLEDLDTAACLELLDRAPVGRVAFVEDDVPVIVPVNFTVDDGEIVIRVAGGSGLARNQGALVAFEVDDVKEWARAGGSVLVVGRACAISDPPREARLRRTFQPWAGGRRDVLIGIPMDRITGRQVPAEPAEVTGQPI